MTANFVTRDIDMIVEALRKEFPSITVAQFQVAHSADDDGLWFVNLPGRPEVQLESSTGNCPFIIESDSAAKRLSGQTVGDVLAKLHYLLA